VEPTDHLVPAGVPPSLRSRAIRLDHLHVAEVAWTRADALAVVDALRDSDAAILGGDVLVNSERGYVHNYDDWYSEPAPDEGCRAFAARSRREARSYLASYAATGEQPHAFILVFDAGA